jgi:hypothetical protein
MTDSRQVYPRVPLEVEHDPENEEPWLTFEPLGEVGHCYTDAEFAAAFIPASLVDDIISAAREADARWSECERLSAPIDPLFRALGVIRAALSAFDAAVQTA